MKNLNINTGYPKEEINQTNNPKIIVHPKIKNIDNNIDNNISMDSNETNIRNIDINIQIDNVHSSDDIKNKKNNTIDNDNINVNKKDINIINLKNQYKNINPEFKNSKNS